MANGKVHYLDKYKGKYGNRIERGRVTHNFGTIPKLVQVLLGAESAVNFVANGSKTRKE